jgi:hypothetical protein
MSGFSNMAAAASKFAAMAQKLRSLPRRYGPPAIVEALDSSDR